MKSTILLPIIIVLVVVVVVAVVTTTDLNLFKKSEGGVVVTAIDKLFDARTLKVQGQMEADIESAGEDSSAENMGAMPLSLSGLKLFLNVSAEIDNSKKDSPKTSSQITLGVDAEGMQLNGVLELRTIDSNVYIRLVSLPSALLAFVGGLEDIKGQWVKIDFEALKEQYSQAGASTAMELDEEQFKQQLQDLTNELQAQLKGKTLFDIKQELAEEEINGVNTKHYLVEANKEAVKEFVIEYVELTKKYVPEEQKAEYESNLQRAMANFSEDFDNFWATIGGIACDIWVEKRGGRLIRVKWQKDIGASAVEGMPETIESIKFSGDFVFSDYNKSVKIEEPAQSKSIEDVLSSVMSSFMPQDAFSPAQPELPPGF